MTNFLHNNQLFHFEIVYNNQDFTILLKNENLEKIGHLSVLVKNDYVIAFDVYLEKKYRRQKLASKMYDYAEIISNKKIIPYEQYSGEYSSYEAVMFWKKRSGIVLTDRNFIYE